MKRGSPCSPDEPPVARMRGRWRYPGAVPHVAALMPATGVLAEMAEGGFDHIPNTVPSQ
jgi:hypothetical protein